MVEILERICIAFYQQKESEAYQEFQQVLPQILKQFEKSGSAEGIPLLHHILDEVQKGDWVMVADIINFELIPVLQEQGGM